MTMVASKTSSKTPAKFNQGKQQSIQPQPKKLKLVGIDFFGAQEPRSKKMNPGTKHGRNLALEKLAKKSEERATTSNIKGRDNH